MKSSTSSSVSTPASKLTKSLSDTIPTIFWLESTTGSPPTSFSIILLTALAMRARPRDFIHTKDNLFFATTTYLHPEDRILSFLRYIPDPNGDRSLNGKRYSKVDSKQAYEFLSQKFPDYLFDCDVTKVQMMGVPINRVETILHPEERLEEILNLEDPDELLKKVIKVADTFHEHAGIPYDKMGISGSTLPGLYKTAQSDVDFVVYGLQNHRKAMSPFSSTFLLPEIVISAFPSIT